MANYAIRYSGDVADARARSAPIVALESTIIAHGLPHPDNLAVARKIEQAVRDNGAVPATIGMIGGEIVCGLDDDQLVRMATADGVAKLSVRDLPVAAATGLDGATTVASTSAIAAASGIGVFATGGLGGVHRGAATTFDESADLTALARTRIALVCAGVKSILDVPATLERLETLGVTVIGYRTRRFPGFFIADSGYPIDWSIDEPAQAASIISAQRDQGVGGAGIVVANPLPVELQLDPTLHNETLESGLERMQQEGITGKAVTPFLLAHFHRATGGRSLAVNIDIILRNAALAAQIAVACGPAYARPDHAGRRA